MNGGLSISNDLAPCIYIAVAPTDENTVYVSTAPGGGARSKLWRSRDGGNSFTDISASLPDRYYSSIDVDPIDPDRVVVTLSGFTPLASES